MLLSGYGEQVFSAGQRWQGFHVLEYTITLAALPRVTLARRKIKVI